MRNRCGNVYIQTCNPSSRAVHPQLLPGLHCVLDTLILCSNTKSLDHGLFTLLFTFFAFDRCFRLRMPMSVLIVIDEFMTHDIVAGKFQAKKKNEICISSLIDGVLIVKKTSFDWLTNLMTLMLTNTSTVVIFFYLKTEKFDPKNQNIHKFWPFKTKIVTKNWLLVQENE